MKTRLLLFLSFVFATLSVSARKAGFEMSFTSSVPADVSKVYVLPLNYDDAKTVPLRLTDGKYTAKVPASVSGFYEVIVVINNGQWMTTVYSPQSKKIKLDIEFDGVSLVENSSAENRALSALNSIVYANNRKLWQEQGMSDAALKNVFESFLSASDSIVSADCPMLGVARYMKAWAYANAKNFYVSIPRAQNRKLRDLSFTDADVLPEMTQVLDNKFAALIPAAMQLVYNDFTATRLELGEMLRLLYDKYNSTAVRMKVADLLANRYLMHHNYAGEFDGGLEYLKFVTEEFDLSDDYVDDYLRRKAIIVGADFPTDVVLVDVNGETVDFSNFKGKYVYVDLWASWCMPCCKEVPHLQALEKELAGGDVVFLSISTDTDVDAWKTKVQELGMHGYQLMDRDNKISEVLNVGGIPFFLVYDKEGKLHTYGAMRPSTGEPLKQFLKNLK